MDRKELCHQWAAQARPRRKAGNISFDGPTLYSYSTAIAHIHSRNCRTRAGESALDAGARERFVLMTDERHSNTTAAHKAAARSAVSHLPLLEVPHIRPGNADEHRENLAHVAAVIADSLAKAGRAQRVWAAEDRMRQARELTRDAERYMDFFKVRGKRPAFDEGAAQAALERARRIENPDPASADKRERERAKRADAKRRREAEAARLEMFHIGAARSNWRLGGAFMGAEFCGYAIHQPVMLRVDDDEIVTSQGARVPLAAAPMVWQLVQRERKACAAGNATHTEFPKSRVRIGDYPLDRIDADGTLHAGCHTIPYSELAALARQLGLA